jgi:ribonuclease MRP protein subunit RMP1
MLIAKFWQISLPAMTSMKLLTPNEVERLTNEYELMHLVYYRSKNQHRLLTWWKYLDIIHRKTRIILKLLIDIDRIPNPEVIRYKQSQVVDTCNYLVNRVFKTAYYKFNCIIALGQFIKLGFVLVGLCSRLFNILVNIKGVRFKSVVINQVVVDTNDDLGEEIVETNEFGETKQTETIEFGETKQTETIEFGETKQTETIELGITNYTSVASGSEKKAKSTPLETRSRIDEIDEISKSKSIDEIFGGKVKKTKKVKKRKKNKSVIDDIFG